MHYSVKVNGELCKEAISRKVISFKTESAAQRFIESSAKNAAAYCARNGFPVPSYEVVATPRGVATYHW